MQNASQVSQLRLNSVCVELEKDLNCVCARAAWSTRCSINNRLQTFLWDRTWIQIKCTQSVVIRQMFVHLTTSKKSDENSVMFSF